MILQETWKAFTGKLPTSSTTSPPAPISVCVSDSTLCNRSTIVSVCKYSHHSLQHINNSQCLQILAPLSATDQQQSVSANTHTTLCNRSIVTASANTHTSLCNISTVTASANTRTTLCNRSTVTASANMNNTLCNRSIVTASANTHTTLCNRSTVTVSANTHTTLCNRSTVTESANMNNTLCK